MRRAIFDIKKQVHLVWFFVVMFTGALTGNAAELQASAYYHNISIPSLDKEQLVVVPFVSDVYNVAAEDYKNVGIVSEETGESVPRLIRQKVVMTEKAMERKHSASVRSLEKGGDNSISLIVNIPEDIGPIHAVKLGTPLHNYERSVSVYGKLLDGKRGERWKKIASKKLLYDYSRFADVRKNRLTFPRENYVALRIDIHAVTNIQASRLMKLKETFKEAGQKESTAMKTLESRPFRVDNVHVFVRHTEEEVSSAIETDFSPDTMSIDTDDADETVVTLKTRREPLTQLRLETDHRNFRRTVVLKTNNKNKGRTLARDVLYDLTYRDFRERQLTVKFDETRPQRLKLLIKNGGNSPLSLEDINLRGHVYEAVFLSKPGESYRLTFAGGESTKEEHTPDNTIIKDLLDKDFVTVAAQLGPRKEKTGDPAFSLRDFLSSKLFFIIITLVMVVILGATLFSAKKYVN